METAREQKPSEKEVSDQLMKCLDRLTTYFTAGSWIEETKSAKNEFFNDAGIVDESDPHFESRIQQFMEWYLLDRRVQRDSVTPAELALELPDFAMTSFERPYFEALSAAQHSLYLFECLRGDDIHLYDLWLGRPLVLKNSVVNMGFNREEVFEARVLSWDQNLYFTRAFCFHPPEAKEFIESELKRLKENHRVDQDQPLRALCLKLMKMKYKHERFTHLSLDMIYTNEKRVRF